jgi:hypothetical protein
MILSVGGNGGDGGFAGSAHGFNHGYGGSGGRGGDARGSASARSTGDVNVSILAIGGAGGETTNPFFFDGGFVYQSPAVSGNGGTAVVDPSNGISTAGGNVSVSATQNGGAGARSDGAHPGNGASSFLTNAVAGSTTGGLTLSQTATGGAGGTSLFETPGLAGDAGSSLTYADQAASLLVATSRAIGGHGGDGNSVLSTYMPVINASPGGNATASISVVGPHVVRATVTATGGDGGHTEVLGSGGAGGVASIPVAFAQSTGGGDVLVAATMTGGNGGFSNAGTSGAGASAIMSNIVAGTTSGALELQQTAKGGNRSPGSSTPAGRGVSTLNLTDLTASSLTATATATGGAASTGTPGDALAEVDLVGRGNTTARSIATGGASSATSTAGTVARATSRSRDGTARADATSNGSSGLANASSLRPADTGVLRSVGGTALAPASRTAHRALTDVGIGSAAQGISAAANIDTVVLATGLPAAADSLARFATAPQTHRDFNIAGEGFGTLSDVLALAVMGDTADLVTAPLTHTSTMSMQIDVDSLAEPQHLMVGLLGSQNSNGGFASLRFRIFAEGSALIDQSFPDVVAAAAYFGDRTLDLGPIDQGVVGDLDLSVQLDFAAMAPSQTRTGQQRFLVDLAIGNATAGAGVPEPSGAFVLGILLAARVGVRRRRGCSS